MRRSKVYDISDEDFIILIKESNSYAECARQLGMSVNGSNSTNQIKKRCEELNLSTNHFSKTAAAHSSTRQPLEDILVENSTYQNISRLKIRLINENKLEYKCAGCGNIGEWNGKELSLQLDHINGNHQDHRIENLRFLCPNCHSQTDTFSGKNKMKH